MFSSIARGLASIGDGMASILGSFGRSSQFDDYDHLMPNGRKGKLMGLEEARKADGQWKDIGGWNDIGQWSDIGKPVHRGSAIRKKEKW